MNYEKPRRRGETLEVLFGGNSRSDFNNLPSLVQGISESLKPPCR